MATTHGPFTFDAENDTDCQRFDFYSTNGGSGQASGVLISSAGSAAQFCHDTNGGNSSGTGPDQGQGGVGDGYFYTECSSPGANGDEYIMEFDTVLNASSEQWQFNFYTLQRGNNTIGENQSTCEVQISEDGGAWTTIEDVGGAGEDQTGGTAWVSRSVDLSNGGVYTDAITRARLLITTATNTQVYYGDYGVDTVTIVGSDLDGITSVTPDEFDMDNGDIDIASTADSFDASGNDVYLSEDDTLAGGITEVDISSAINTEAVGLINLDLTQLSAAELTSLHSLGIGARYLIVDATGGEYSWPVTLHRPEAFVMSLGAGTPGATTARLTAPATKTTGDFDAGRFEEAANPATTVDITADDYTEMVWSIEAKILSREVSYDFRVTKVGVVLDTYTVTPQVTVTAEADDDLTMEGIKVTPTVGAPAIGQTHALSVEGVKTTPTVGAPTLGQIHALSVEGIKSTPTVGAPAFGHIHVLDVEGIKSTPTVGTPSIGQTHELIVDGIKSTPTVGAPTLGHIHVLFVEGIKTSPTVGAPTLGTEGEDILTVEGIKASPTVGSPTLGQTHILAIEGIKTSPTVGAPTLEHVHTLFTEGVNVSPTVGVPSIDQIHVLSVEGIKATPTVGTPTLGTEGFDSLTVEGIKTTPTVGAPTLGQTHVLITDGIKISPAVGAPVLGQSHILGVEGIKVTPTVGAPLIEHIHALTMEGIKAAPTVGAPTLGHIHALTIGGITVSPTVGNVTIGQTHVLTMEGINISPTVGAPLLSGSLLVTTTTLSFFYSGGGSMYLMADFDPGGSVTIDVYILNLDSLVVDAEAMTEIGTSGVYKYNFIQSVTDETEYFFVATDGTYEQRGKGVLQVGGSIKDANIVKVLGDDVSGDGSDENPWNPTP